MESVVLVLMILVCFNFILKQTFRKRYSVLGFAALCALFVGLAWPYAIEQSKSQIAGWLADPALMLDTSVLLSIEVVLQMGFCLLATHVQSSGELPRRTVWAYRLLRWFPGVLIFAVLFSLLVAAIFALPGRSFALVAWGLAAVVLLAVPLGTWLLHRLLPEKEIRLELLFLTNALIAILGVVATVNGRTAVAAVGEVDWQAFGGMAALVLVGGGLGWLIRRIRLRRQHDR